MTDLQRFRMVRAADVYKSGRRAAQLTKSSEGTIEFRYLPEYSAHSGRPIATTLPVTDEPIHIFDGSLPAYFAGLLPEGHRLSVLQRAVKTSLDDELTLLLAVGTDAPGDVQVVPAGEPLVEVPALVDGEAPEDLDFGALVDKVDPHALPGVQEKASTSMISTPLSTGFGRFILKLSQSGFPNLVENEAVHLEAARELKVPVAAAQLITDRTGTSGLLVQRFDRVAHAGTWTRSAFEDATQVMGLPPAEKYAVDAIDAVRTLAAVTHAPRVAVRNLYLQFVFAWLTGNGDLHGKNLGVLEDAKGRWSIAPIYDIPCTLIYDDDSMALPIGGRIRKLKARDWLAFAAEIGLPERGAASARAIALRAAEAVDFDRLPFAGSPLRRVERELRFRRGELQRL
ncbi:type II toxin-antitoxin system HipA family toxin [Nocardia carnea]|uniref:Type II toxin-antitoxin system HipA family toxin n=1 Tax=Nocardia carnea TaxID=37328 RepID=A0ABW7TVA6_9NOCA|nr:HipA domain-containing protein [Nocardia carnea]